MRPGIVSVVALIGAVGFVSAVHAVEPVTIGNSSVIVRTVTGKLDAEVRKLSMWDDVYHNELIETAEQSATEIVFLDQTKLALGANSSLVLDSVVFDPDPAKSSFITTTSKGVFRFVTGNLPKKSYTIHTPNATIGIRGTVFELSIQPLIQANGMLATVVKVRLENGAADLIGCHGTQVSLEHGGQSITVTKDATGACTQSISEF